MSSPQTRSSARSTSPSWRREVIWTPPVGLVVIAVLSALVAAGSMAVRWRLRGEPLTLGSASGAVLFGAVLWWWNGRRDRRRTLAVWHDRGVSAPGARVVSVLRGAVVDNGSFDAALLVDERGLRFAGPGGVPTWMYAWNEIALIEDVPARWPGVNRLLRFTMHDPEASDLVVRASRRTTALVLRIAQALPER